MRCWADILGGCQGGQSREHYLTKGLYAGNVKAVGLPWSRQQPVDLPIDCLAANILCKHHNEALSPVDAEAIRLKDFVLAAMKCASAPQHSVRHTWRTVEWSKIARWFSKTICNLGALANRAPDERYVRHAFGVRNTTVSVYMDKVLWPKTDGDASHLHFEQWIADLKAGGQTTVYVIRFAILEWLVAPFPLTQDECDALGVLTQSAHWFKAQPVVRTRRIPIGYHRTDSKTAWTHLLVLRIPRRRRRR